jgi:hypothetical protein
VPDRPAVGYCLHVWRNFHYLGNTEVRYLGLKQNWTRVSPRMYTGA